MHKLGIGTTWFIEAEEDEITRYLNHAINNLGHLMIDTAHSYESQELLGKCLEDPDAAFIATKWGESISGKYIKHNIGYMGNNLVSSILSLPRIDLYYIHRANRRVLQDEKVIQFMSMLSCDIGASISEEEELLASLPYLDWMDYIQCKADVYLRNREKIDETNKHIVVNAPYRKRGNRSFRQIMSELIDSKATILTGSRNHLDEVISLFI